MQTNVPVERYEMMKEQLIIMYKNLVQKIIFFCTNEVGEDMEWK